MSPRKPPEPDGLPMGTAGRKLWAAVTASYELEEHEALLLREACRTADALDGLAGIVEREGLLADSSQGQRAHPALTESRAQRITLARLLAAMRLPAGEEGDQAEEQRRPQRRAGARGVYSVGEGAS